MSIGEYLLVGEQRRLNSLMARG